MKTIYLLLILAPITLFASSTYKINVPLEENLAPEVSCRSSADGLSLKIDFFTRQDPGERYFIENQVVYIRKGPGAGWTGKIGPTDLVPETCRITISYQGERFKMAVRRKEYRFPRNKIWKIEQIKKIAGQDYIIHWETYKKGFLKRREIIEILILKAIL